MVIRSSCFMFPTFQYPFVRQDLNPFDDVANGPRIANIVRTGLGREVAHSVATLASPLACAREGGQQTKRIRASVLDGSSSEPSSWAISCPPAIRS